jgi:hypothetical protein
MYLDALSGSTISIARLVQDTIGNHTLAYVPPVYEYVLMPKGCVPQDQLPNGVYGQALTVPVSKTKVPDAVITGLLASLLVVGAVPV